MQSKLREWGPVLLLALIPALPLALGNGLVNTRAGGDSPFLLVRVHQLAQNLSAGVFPVRWMPLGAYGLGFPFFDFYASLPYYLAALLKMAGAGFITSIQLTQTLGFVLAGLGLYGFCRERQPNQRVANVVAALVYGCAPFHLVNVYVRGDSLSEFYAFVFFPLILWGLLRLHKRPDVASAAWVSLSFAGLVTTHNVSGLMFAPFALLYAVWLAWETKDFVRLARSLTALLVGLLSSMWFWLPALSEQGNVYLKNVMTTGYFHYSQHFRGWDLVQPGLLFNYTIDANQQPFRMGFLQAMVAGGSFFAVLARRIRLHPAESTSTYGLVVLAVCTVMITPLSQALWDRISLLQLVQFPWRFLSIQALGISLAATSLFDTSRRGPGASPERFQQLLAAALGALLIASAILRLRPERLEITDLDVSSDRLMLYEYFTANVGTTVRADYLPVWVDPRPYTSEVFLQGTSKPAPLAMDGEVASAILTHLGPTSERWILDIASPQARLAFQTYFFPGWQALVDDRRAEIEVQDGLGYIGLLLPQGRHEVVLRYGRAHLHYIAEMISFSTLLALLAGLLLRARRLRGAPLARTLIPSLGIAALLTWWLLAMVKQPRLPPLTEGAPVDIPATQNLDLTMDFDRIPYLHHNPAGVLFGTVAELEQYQLSSTVLQAGEVLKLTSHWGRIQHDDLTAVLSLVSPAQHLLGAPMAVGTDERHLVGQRSEHQLQIPASTTRGIYLLTLRVFDGQEEVRPINSLGETLGTTYLVPIRIDNWIPAGEDALVKQYFGDRIALSTVEAWQNVAGGLDVSLTWWVLAQPAQNYKTALRLRDASGREVAQLDTQPGYGFYPTGMWRPGELVLDHYTVPIADGTPPGSEYSLDITLYESATLLPIGSISIPGVSLLYPSVRETHDVLHRFTTGLGLSQAQLPQTEVEQGDTLSVLLKWAAVQELHEEYSCFLTLRGATGVALDYPLEPLARAYSTRLWPQGAVVSQYYDVRIAPDCPVGSYSVTVTVVASDAHESIGTFTLARPLTVIEAVRSFAIPQMQTTVGADFGGKIRLLGYDLNRSGALLRLRLHWQAMSQMTTDYKLFVHLLDPQTETIVAQFDTEVGGSAFPSTRWAPLQVLSDDVTLELASAPAGAYRLAVGLYYGDARLPVDAPVGLTVSADRLLLQELVSVP